MYLPVLGSEYMLVEYRFACLIEVATKTGFTVLGIYFSTCSTIARCPNLYMNKIHKPQSGPSCSKHR